MLRSNAPVLQETPKRNIVRHPGKLFNVLGQTNVRNRHENVAEKKK